MRPNLVLITVDQMRRDCMSAAGHPIVETPNLDTMCRHGYRFSHACSATPTCIPARAALLTGTGQRSHGRVGYRDGVDWNYAHTLPGELTKAGYQTECVGKMHVAPARNRCGFEHVVLHDGYLLYSRRGRQPFGESYEGTDDYLHWLRQRHPGTDLSDTGLECNSWVARPWPYAENLHPTNWCAGETIDFLRRRDPTRPFFLHTSFVRPHSPLDPPEYYLNMYLQKEIPLPPVGDWADKEDTDRCGMLYDCNWGKIPPEALKRARAAYYGLITHVDHQIGRILQAFREYGLMDKTVFLFTSDHGDMLGDHNLFRKALPYEGSMGIPLVLYDPGLLISYQQGKTVESLAELRDVMPTLLELAGVQCPECVEGKSLLAALKGDPLREYLHGEHTLEEYSNQFIVTPYDKYIWYSQTGREQYFDLVQDPGELHDLIEDSRRADRMAQADCIARADRIDRLRQYLITELAGREEGYSDGTQLIAGRKPVSCLEIIGCGHWFPYPDGSGIPAVPYDPLIP